MHRQQRLDDRCSVIQLRTEGPPALCPGLHNLLQADCLTGQLLADRPTEEALVMEDSNLGHIVRVVADGHRFPDVGREGQVQVAEAEEVDPILVDFAWLRHVSSNRSSCSSEVGR